jgi:hypothetical protein
MSGCIMFFVKYPEPGEVKTRLAEESTSEGAAEFYRVFVEEKLVELKGATDGELMVFYTPEVKGRAMADWLGPEYRFVAQKGVELGRRMENAFREAFFMGHDRVILVGSDIPGLTSDILNTALAFLEPGKACIGPAEDGGYYLVGFHRKSFVPEIFHNMEWGMEDVLQRTVDRFEGSDIELVQLERLDDMDTFEDVETLAVLGSIGPLKGKSLKMAKKLIGM